MLKPYNCRRCIINKLTLTIVKWVFENLPFCTTMVITKNIDNLISVQFFFDIEDLIDTQFLKEKNLLDKYEFRLDLGLTTIFN
jgi:hypothetical protein